MYRAGGVCRANCQSLTTMCSHIGQLVRSTDEQVTPIDAQVVGELPNWLSGNFIRLGPGKFEIDDFQVNHWFDGFSVLCKFTIKDGKVTFSKRFLQSDAYKKALGAGKPVYTEFGTKAYTDPSKNIFSRMMSTLSPELTDNNAVNLFTISDNIFAASETCNLRRIDLCTLDTQEKVDLYKLVGVHLISSHMITDKDGTSYTMATTITSGIKYNIVKIPQVQAAKHKDAFSKAQIVCSITPGWKGGISYYHSFGMSENYIVFVEQPLIINNMRLLSVNMKGRSLRECMDWDPNNVNRFYIIGKATGKVIDVKYKSTKPFFMFHHINTYEEDGQLILDVIAQDNFDTVDRLYIKDLREAPFDVKHPAGAQRFVLPLSVDKQNTQPRKNLVTLKTSATAEVVNDAVLVSPHILTQPGYEMPVINKQYFGKKYRYFYATAMFDPGQYHNSIIKIDVETGNTLTWFENGYMYPGEAQFVPKPGAEDEDDGILLSGVTDVRADQQDFLLILDAKTLKEICRAYVNCHLPYITHGLFVSDK